MQKGSFRYILMDGSLYVHSEDAQEAQLFLDSLRRRSSYIEEPAPQKVEYTCSVVPPVNVRRQKRKANVDPLIESYYRAKQNGHNGGSPDDLVLLRRNIAERYQDFVTHVASNMARLLPPHIEMGDLVGEGWIGFFDALEKFDPVNYFGSFKTYASMRVRGAILDSLRSEAKSQVITRSVLRIWRAADDLEGRLERMPSAEELYEFIAQNARGPLSLSYIREALKGYGTISLNTTVQTNNGHDSELGDNIPDANTISPDREIETQDSRKALAQAIGMLDERERGVMEDYYFGGKRLWQIGDDLGVSESRVCQIHTKAVHRLRKGEKKNLAEQA